MRVLSLLAAAVVALFAGAASALPPMDQDPKVQVSLAYNSGFVSPKIALSGAQLNLPLNAHMPASFTEFDGWQNNLFILVNGEQASWEWAKVRPIPVPNQRVCVTATQTAERAWTVKVLAMMPPMNAC